jgi:hypothetical protein
LRIANRQPITFAPRRSSATWPSAVEHNRSPNAMFRRSTGAILKPIRTAPPPARRRAFHPLHADVHSVSGRVIGESRAVTCGRDGPSHCTVFRAVGQCGQRLIAHVAGHPLPVPTCVDSHAVGWSAALQWRGHTPLPRRSRPLLFAAYRRWNAAAHAGCEQSSSLSCRWGLLDGAQLQLHAYLFVTVTAVVTLAPSAPGG